MRMRNVVVVFLALLLAGGSAAAGGEPRADRTVRLSFIGDIMCHKGNLAMRDYRDIYREVEGLLQSDDLTFANLESPADPQRAPAGYPRFNAPPSWVDAAVEAGVDVFSLANNHAFDQGLEGVQATPGEVERAGRTAGRAVYWSGTRGSTAEAWTPVTIDLDGLQVGFLAVTQFLNLPQGVPYVETVDYLDQQAADRFVQEVARIAPRYDLFVLSYHGDREYQPVPSPQKMAFFRQLVESGVDVVFSQHPHVLQRPEMVQVGASRRLILSSMGNFISAMGIYLDPATGKGEVPGTADSAIMRVEVQVSADGATVAGADAALIATHWSPRGELVVGRLASLASDTSGLPPVWTAWYAKRLQALRALLGGVVPSE
jgi:hypothetical protein